jgi:hypothetical protein
VGLAAFAAAAISREDPIATGFQGALYALRTAVLPFVFIFNPAMLLIGIDNWAQGIFVIAVSLIAILLFSAATMNWFITRSRLWESAVLLLVCFTLFRPDFWLNQFYPSHVEAPAAGILEEVAATPPGGRLDIVVEGITLEGDEVRKTVSLRLDAAGDPQARLREAGVMLSALGDRVSIMNVGFGSYADRIGLEPGFDVVAVRKPAERPPQVLPVAVGLAVAAGIAALQWQRRRATTTAIPRPA